MLDTSNTSLLFWEAVSFVVFMALFLRFVYPGVRRFRRRLEELADERSGPDAIEVLDQRYASGEITREEYLKVKSDMMENRDA